MRAAVLNDFFHTLGGGELSTLAYAHALRKLGAEVEIVSRHPLPSADDVARTFGSAWTQSPMRTIPGGPLAQALGYRPDVFINHSFHNFEPCPGRVSLYVCMFPVLPLEPEQRAALGRYRTVLCISRFTARHARRRWDLPDRRCRVLMPPLPPAPAPAAGAGSRERRLLTVGRYQPDLHSKNQLLLIEAFCAARARFPELDGWSLVVAGIVPPTPGGQEYFARCQARAGGEAGVEVLRDVPRDRLDELFHTSFGYVHATGADLAPDEQPERCEHFGLSIAEALRQGCLPLVHGRGGMAEFIRDRRLGLLFASVPALAPALARLASLRDQPDVCRRLRARAATALRELDHDLFTRRLSELVPA